MFGTEYMGERMGSGVQQQRTYEIQSPTPETPERVAGTAQLMALTGWFRANIQNATGVTTNPMPREGVILGVKLPSTIQRATVLEVTGVLDAAPGGTSYRMEATVNGSFVGIWVEQSGAGVETISPGYHVCGPGDLINVVDDDTGGVNNRSAEATVWLLVEYGQQISGV